MATAIERALLTKEQIAFLEAEERARNPRWDLHPPQRDEYNSDMWYVVALGKYADRCMVAKGGG